MLRLPLAAAAAASLFSIQLSLNAIGPPENSADAHSLRRTRSFTLKLELWHWGGCAATRVRLRAQRVRGSTCLTHEALEQIPLACQTETSEVLCLSECPWARLSALPSAALFLCWKAAPLQRSMWSW